MNGRQIPASGKLGRRSVLGLLSAAPLAASGVIGLAQSAQAGTVGNGDAPTGEGPPPALLPGGAYDRYVSRLAAEDRFSGTVLLAWHGEPVLVRSYQQADKARDMPNQADTIFMIASVTKFFTGVAVAQLAAQGKIDLYATVGTYLDGFPAAIADVVTVHQLLTQTSGLQVENAAPSAKWKTNAEAFNGMLAQLRKQPLATTPGQTYAYSDSNYFLAGAIVAAVSGQNFWDYIPEHILTPAQMTSSAFYTGHQWRTDPRIAHPYGPPVPGGQRQDVTAQLSRGPSGYSGAGGLFSTAPDLLRFTCALADGTLLPPAWAGLRANGMFPIGPAGHNSDQPPGPTWIGYGSDERIVGGQRAYGHTGGIDINPTSAQTAGGLSTALEIYPGLGVVAIVLSNYYLYPGIGTFLTEQDRIITQASS